MTRLFVVRHGNTFEKGDTVLRVGARTNLPLSPSGQTQANQLAAHFAPTRLASLASSPLQRAQQTAQSIATAQPSTLTVTTQTFLTELDYGPDDGQPETAVIARLGQAALDVWESDAILPPGWLANTQAITNAWETFLTGLHNAGADHMVVTSNGVARFALKAKGVQVPNPATSLKLRTGAYGVLESTPSGWLVSAWDVRPT